MVNAVQAKSWLGQFDALVAELESGSLGVVQALCGLGRNKLDALEARALAGEVGADGDTRRAARLAAQNGKRSKAAARAAARRAKAVAENKGLADAMASGDLSTEQVDTIASAMDTDASAATDQALIDAVATSSVSEGRKAARDWQARKTSKEAADTEHERQRKLRRAFRYDSKAKGLAAITIEGDHTTVAELWNLIAQRERALRQADGGRELSFNEHPRTYDQRLFDAVADLVRGDGAGFGGRPSIVITVPADRATARVAGGQPISDTNVHDLLRRSQLSVAIVDNLSGEPLAWARLKRNATTQQFIALVVRDHGCVLCGASWTNCQAHHRTPWHAPAKGNTDLNNLVLVCSDCHHHVHAAHLTIIRNTAGTWTTRPATPDEIAPTRRATQDSKRMRAGAQREDQRHSHARCADAVTSAARAHAHHNPSLQARPGGTRQASRDRGNSRGGDHGADADAA